LNNFDKTDGEYSLAPTDDLILDFKGQDHSRLWRSNRVNTISEELIKQSRWNFTPAPTDHLIIFWRSVSHLLQVCGGNSIRIQRRGVDFHLLRCYNRFSE